MEETIYSIDGRVIPTINGGSGSGNFGHSGRPGKVGGSAPDGGSKGKAYFDEYDAGTTPFTTQKDGDKYTVKSMATDEATHGIMESSGLAQRVAKLAYDKDFKDADSYTKEAGLALTSGANRILAHISKMGDHASGFSTDFDYEVHDTALDQLSKVQTAASLAMVQIRDKDSKTYKKLKKAQDELRETYNILAKMNLRHLRVGEKKDVDVTDLFK